MAFLVAPAWADDDPKDVATKDNEETTGLLLPAVQKVRSSATAQPGIEPDEIDARATSAAPAAPRSPMPATRASSASAVTPGEEPQERAGGYMKIGDIKGESTEAQSQGNGATGQTRRRGEAVLEDMSGSASAREMDKASPKLQEMNAGGRSMSTQQMMLKLRPRTSVPMSGGASGAASTANKVAAPSDPQGYEIAECGTAQSPMICCHHEAGDGSTCNMFQMLCENAGGTAQGDGTDATCSDW